MARIRKPIHAGAVVDDHRCGVQVAAVRPLSVAISQFVNRVLPPPDCAGTLAAMYAIGEIIAGHFGEASKPGATLVAALAVTAANASMLYFYFAFDLTLFQIVLVYWWEALWIGLFGGLKLLTASLFGDPYQNRWVDVSPGASIVLSVFAIIRSGGAFLTLLALTGVALVVARQGPGGTSGTDFVSEQVGLILKCSMLFFAGHGLSFIINFLLLGEFRRARIGALLWLPFRRCIALFVTVVAALTTMQAFPGVFTHTGFAAALIVVKLAWDYVLHRRERGLLTMNAHHEAPAQ